MICGLVLAGGRSSRFGAEKSVAPLGGEPMIAWVVRALRRGVDPIAVNTSASSGAAKFAALEGLALVMDHDALQTGPLSGIAAGLSWANTIGADWMVTAPCDTPFLPDGMVARLVDGRTKGGAVACSPAGLQPLCALWPASALLRMARMKDHPPIREVLAELGAATVRFDGDDAFANLNTPADFTLAEIRLAPH